MAIPTNNTQPDKPHPLHGVESYLDLLQAQNPKWEEPPVRQVSATTPAQTEKPTPSPQVESSQPPANAAGNATTTTQGTAPVSTTHGMQDPVTAQVAKQVREFAETLGLNPNDPNEHDRVARELIENRKYTTKDGIVVTIASMDKDLNKNPAMKNSLESQFGQGATLETTIPTAEKRDAINAAIKYGEEQNTGIFGVGLGNLLMGLLSWIMGGEGSLKDNIATVTANNVAGDVAKHLAGSGKLNSEEIARVADSARTIALEKGGVQVAKQDIPQTASSTSPQQQEQQSTGQDISTASTAAEPPGRETGGTNKPGKKPVTEKSGQTEGQTKKEPEKQHASVPASRTKHQDKPQKGNDPEKTEHTQNEPEKKEPTKKVTEKPAHTDREKTAGTSNLEKAVSKMIDAFLGREGVKNLELSGNDIKSVKHVVLAELNAKRSDSVLSGADYNGNYQQLAGDLANSIVNKTNISKHERLKATPVVNVIQFFANTIQEFLVEGNGTELRKAVLRDNQDKARQTASLEGKKLGELGVNASGNATTLAMRSQQNNAAGAGLS